LLKDIDIAKPSQCLYGLREKNRLMIMEAIKAVIFDWGGVLIEDPGPPMMRHLADAIVVPEDKYIATQRQFISDFRTGRINEAEFWKRLCGELGIATPKDSLWAAAFEAAYRPKPEMFELARALKQSGLKIALLSNTELPAVEFFDRQEYDLFDVVVFSCVEGTKKPERQIYVITLGKLGCRPAEAVFIDDQPNCIEGAKAVGLTAILFESPSQVKKELAFFGIRVN